MPDFNLLQQTPVRPVLTRRVRCVDVDPKQSARFKAWYEKNRETVLAKTKARVAADPKKESKRKRKYYKKNREREIARVKERYWSDPEYRAARLAGARKRYQDNIERERAKRRALYAKQKKVI